MKKYLTIALMGVPLNAVADLSGFYLGSGIGYGVQALSYEGSNKNQATPSFRIHGGYQIANWMSFELGWNYLTQGNNWNSISNVSTTVYDLSMISGYTFPKSPITIYGRLGVAFISSNINGSWYSELFSTLKPAFEYGGGFKFTVPSTNTFFRVEYINYGSVTNNSNPNLNTASSALLVTAGYIF